MGAVRSRTASANPPRSACSPRARSPRTVAYSSSAISSANTTYSNCARASVWLRTDLYRQLPEFEDPLDAVVTGLSAVTGRWRDTYTDEEYARARQLLRDFRVSYLEGKEMWRLSEGERTRVLIARALMGDPRTAHHG